MVSPEIKVTHNDDAAFWGAPDPWEAVEGDYDLGSKVGSGSTPLDAIVDLLDQQESAR